MTRARDLGDFIADGAAAELVVDTTTLVVDSTNNRVGIGTASPSQALEVTGTAKLATVDIDAGAIDGAVIGANSAAAGTFTALTASGTTTITTADINGGAIDGTIIGANSAAAVTATTLNASTKLQVNGTDVITNARQLSNIASVDSATVTALSNAGVGSANSFDATMTGSVADGKPMILKTDGTLEAVGLTITALNPPQSSNETNIQSSGFAGGFSSCFHPPTNKTVVVYRDSDDNNKVKIRLITVADGSSAPTVSNPTEIGNSTQAYDLNIAYDPSTENVVVVYQGVNFKGWVVAASIAANGTVTWGTPLQFFGNNVAYVSVACASSASTGGSFGSVIIAYRDNSNNGDVILYNLASNRTFTLRNEATFNSGSNIETDIKYDPDENRFLVVYRDSGNSGQGRAIVIQITNPTNSGSNSMSLGSATTFNTNVCKNTRLVYDTNANKMVILYVVENASGSNDRYFATVATITASGNSVAFGTNTQITTTNANGGSDRIVGAFDSDAVKVTICFMANNGASNEGYGIAGTVSGTSISFGLEDTDITAGQTPSNGFGANMGYDTSNAGGTAVQATIIVFNIGTQGICAKLKNQTQATNLTTTNYIGIADAAYTNGQTATVQTQSAIDDAQSSLTIGSKYYVQSDGTIGTSAGSPSVEAGLAVSATKLLVKG